MSENPITLASTQSVPESSEDEASRSKEKESLHYLNSLGNAIAPLGEMARFLKLTSVTQYLIMFHPLVSYLTFQCSDDDTP